MSHRLALSCCNKGCAWRFPGYTLHTLMSSKKCEYTLNWLLTHFLISSSPKLMQFKRSIPPALTTASFLFNLFQHSIPSLSLPPDEVAPLICSQKKLSPLGLFPSRLIPALSTVLPYLVNLFNSSLSSGIVPVGFKRLSVYPPLNPSSIEMIQPPIGWFYSCVF